MSERPPAGRGIFGVRRSEVERLIAERDAELQQARARIQAAEARVADVEAELSRLVERNEQLEGQVEELRSVGQGEAAGSDASELTPRFLSDELGTILSAAEESATRIMERARQATEQQVAEAERVWRETQAQIARLAAWRDRVDPLLRTTRARIDEARTRIAEVPDQIRQALVPLADAVASLEGDLADVARKATPPLLGAPAPEGTEPPADQATSSGG
jgi:predicted nuclease with TOPRIM domain